MHGFPPLIDKQSRVLILGSFPGPESLKKKQYYGFAANQFWEFLGSALGVDVKSLPYADRLEAVRRARIAIWDVVASCTRATSADTHIRNVRFNDLQGLLRAHTNIATVLCNGSYAYAHASKQDLPVPVHRLPSTSGRSARLVKAEKQALWIRAMSTALKK